MTEITAPAETLAVTVRFFAAARDAAGVDSLVLSLPSGAGAAEAIDKLCGQSDRMRLVLQKCSYLCDGFAVRDPALPLSAGQTLDVLPPFAGG